MPSREDIATFSLNIENYASTTGLDYVDAIIEYCEVNDLEIEMAAKLVSINLKAKIENDANIRNLLKEKGAKLPI
jgi:hypothetical protein